MKQWLRPLLRGLGAIAMTIALMAPLVTTWFIVQEVECPEHLGD